MGRVQLGQKADQGAQKANQGIDQGAQRIQEEAGPRAKQFTDEQMMPAANKVLPGPASPAPDGGWLLQDGQWDGAWKCSF